MSQATSSTNPEVGVKAALAACIVRECSGVVKVTGEWVWIQFNSKPGQEVRNTLKTEGFRWSPKKEMWYWAGKPCARSKGMPWFHITDKYGEEVVEAA